MTTTITDKALVESFLFDRDTQARANARAALARRFRITTLGVEAAVGAAMDDPASGDAVEDLLSALGGEADDPTTDGAVERLLQTAMEALKAGHLASYRGDKAAGVKAGEVYYGALGDIAELFGLQREHSFLVVDVLSENFELKAYAVPDVATFRHVMADLQDGYQPTTAAEDRAAAAS